MQHQLPPTAAGDLIAALTAKPTVDLVRAYSAIRHSVFCRMINDPKQVKLAIYPEAEGVDWYGYPHQFEHEGGENLDELERDAEERLDAGATGLDRAYLEAALTTIDYFRQQRRNRL
jgi:hypothetical protein